MRKLILLFSLISCCAFSQAQTNVKLNSVLVKELSKTPHRNVNRNLLVKGDAEKVASYVKTHGGQFKYSAKDICSVVLPLNEVIGLSKQNFVSKIDAPNQKMRVMDDSSAIKCNYKPIHLGQAPLSQAYDGSGVIFGYVDTGLDFAHPDFKDSLGKTRAVYIWDMAKPQATNTPQPYNYGQEWNKDSIDAGVCTHLDANFYAHGTRVAGIAAGNGASNIKYKGVAPKADIICCAYDFNNDTAWQIVDGVNYLIQKAIALGKPISINISLGDYIGSHDGQDLQAQMIDALVTSQSGVFMAAAAGNAGGYNMHFDCASTAADTSFFWVKSGAPQFYFQIVGDSTGFKNVRHTISANNPASFNYVGNIGFNPIDSTLGVLRIDTLKNLNGNRIGIVTSTTSIEGNAYLMEVLIQQDSLNYLWAYECNGNAQLDSWSFDAYLDSLPSVLNYPNIANYVRADSMQTICTSFQCSNELVTVANFTAATGHIDLNNNFAPDGGITNDLSGSSSWGPTRDGRIKPDIAATGDNIITTASLAFAVWNYTNYPASPSILTEDTLHMKFDGTSAASPVVAGFGALYLQKFPSATNQIVKQDIINCAAADSYTGAVPNQKWGYGKLDGFGAMLCNTQQIGISEVSNFSGVDIFPNPTSEILTISITNCKNALIDIMDITGKIIHTSKVNSTITNVDVKKLGLAKGVYLMRILNGSEISFKKVIIE